MSSPLKSPDPSRHHHHHHHQHLQSSSPLPIEEEAENLHHQFNRTPRPYFRDGYQVPQAVYDGGHERDPSRGSVVSEQGRHHGPHYDHDDRNNEDGSGESEEEWHKRHRRSGHGSIVSSESGTEADDERPDFAVKALPPPTVRPRKGLKTGEQSEDAFLTPSMLDDEGRRLSEGYFRRTSSSEDTKKKTEEEEKAEQEKLLRRRLAEFARRSSEVALMAVTIACVLSGRGVWQTAAQWQRELFSQVGIIAVLILVYPVKLSIVDTQATHTKLWQRFRVPASFDPATVLYPTLLPILVALSVSPAYPAIILPNIILGLSALPQRLFPRSSRLSGINAVHWFISIIPLILSEHTGITFLQHSPQPYLLKSGPPEGLTSEALVSLYPLHHALLVPLHYITTTSLLTSELHLLSAALINVLLMAASPQTVILKACIWVGGASLFVFAGPVLHWNLTLARVPRWKLRRAGHDSQERKSFADAVSDLINLQRATLAFKSGEDADSDADEDEPPASIKGKMNGVTRLATTGNAFPTLGSFTKQEPQSAVEPRQVIDGVLSQAKDRARPRRFSLPPRGNSPLPAPAREPSNRSKARRKVFWCLQLTPEQAERRRWIYAAWIYAALGCIVLGPVYSYISRKALTGQDPMGWVISYLFGQLPILRHIVKDLGLATWTPLPPPGGDWRELHFGFPLNINQIRITIGLANTRLLLIAYLVSILIVGLLAVFALTAYVEVDTRRKVFHGTMVVMLVPSIFVDPCFCALALAGILTMFLILEVIRAGQVPPLGNAIGRFVAPYVDGRDLRGPVVVSHIFLLIGCAIPLWLTLASVGREGGLPWEGWELAENRREIAMVAGVVCVGMGDAAASLIGRRYGRRKWIWVGGKSLEGSGAFAAAVTVGLMAAKVWQVLGGWNDTRQPLDSLMGSRGSAHCVAAWFVTLLKAMFCACGASFMEAVLTGANDNVVVPVALWLLVKGSRL